MKQFWPVICHSGDNDKCAAVVDGGETTGRSRWQMARIALAFARHREIEDAESRAVKVALAPTVQQRMKNVGNSPA